jgi:UDP:flavonoid glycosyltransferase YjiC (YdhE family)
MSSSHIHKGRVVLTTFGSLGDLNPFIALALGLQKRGFQPLIATSPYYGDYVCKSGLLFRPIRPDLDPKDKELINRAMHPRKGTEVILREIIFPSIRDTYEDLSKVIRETDLLITHSISYAGHIFAERNHLPWISVVLSPIVFLSAYDMPALQGFPLMDFLKKLDPAANRLLIKFIKKITLRWCRPALQLRESLGLSQGKHPIFENQYSAQLVLAMFSNLLARCQPDWPSSVHITGYSFFDATEDENYLPYNLERFLKTGEPPVVFALGSVAVYTAGDFYHKAVKAAYMLNRRAVLVVGRDTDNLPEEELSPDIMTIQYAPYSKLFPQAAAIVHQGGIGTMGQAMKAGKPMLVVPFAHDQPDNAHRLERLGISSTLPLKRCTPELMARQLKELISDVKSIERAGKVGQRVRSEDGVETACNTIETAFMLNKKRI